MMLMCHDAIEKERNKATGECNQWGPQRGTVLTLTPFDTRAFTQWHVEHSQISENEWLRECIAGSDAWKTRASKCCMQAVGLLNGGQYQHSHPAHKNIRTEAS